MSILFRYVWFTKVCLTGWSAYKACVGDNSNTFICIMSVSYFGILFMATICSWRSLNKPRQLENMEAEYLRRLEEGVAMENEKPE